MNISQIEIKVGSLLTDLAGGSCTQSDFIYELLLAYGHRKQSVTRLRSGERNLSSASNEPRHDEVIWKRQLYFKRVSTNKLHSEVDEMRREKLVESNKIRFVVVTNFDQLLAVDTKTHDTLDIEIGELSKSFDFLLPWAGMEKALYQGENPADVKAAEKMAKLFDLIKADNFDESLDEDAGALHNLNVFLTRLLFCFFAEDTEIFGENQFSLSVQSHTREDGSDLSRYLDRLFLVLNTADNQREGLPDYLDSFPYVNGGLFSDDVFSPNFSARSRRMLVECGNDLDWSDINPDIFGSMIQAVVHPDQRGGMGVHYTSVTNIMKVIEPLFLNDLYGEIEKDDGSSTKLQRLQQRLGDIKIFDPACGSGNFLIIAYKELRKLEMEVLKRLQELELEKIGQIFQPFSVIKLSQFYGIELDDFAHEVSILSLWLAEHQLNVEFKSEFGEAQPMLPLKEGGSIQCVNATMVDWNDACPNDGVSSIFVIGNPPYQGFKSQTKEQKEDMGRVLGALNGYKSLDYIACWFYLAAEYLTDNVKAGFVSTNSICQGAQVELLWPHIRRFGVEIGFSVQPFKWTNNARSAAGVTCIIIGLRTECEDDKFIFDAAHRYRVGNVNSYLVDARDVVVSKERSSISGLPKISDGSGALDGGNLILSEAERKELVESHDMAADFIKNYVGSNEFIKGIPRFCIWVENNELEDALKIPLIEDRINKTRIFRENAGTRARTAVGRPHKFAWINKPEKSQIIVPTVSSERRTYIPIGFLDKSTVVSNSASVIHNPKLYVFAIITSRMHMVWVKAVAGRLEERIRYTSALCYNTFPLPQLNEAQKEELTKLALDILEIRERYSDRTMASLYDPERMPQDLEDAHTLSDRYVDAIYFKDEFVSDSQRLECLFHLYEEMTGGQNA